MGYLGSCLGLLMLAGFRSRSRGMVLCLAGRVCFRCFFMYGISLALGLLGIVCKAGLGVFRGCSGIRGVSFFGILSVSP